MFQSVPISSVASPGHVRGRLLSNGMQPPPRYTMQLTPVFTTRHLAASATKSHRCILRREEPQNDKLQPYHLLNLLQKDDRSWKFWGASVSSPLLSVIRACIQKTRSVSGGSA